MSPLLSFLAHLPSSSLCTLRFNNNNNNSYSTSARGDRMKQAQVDADELIAAYRLEQQEAFDKKAATDGALG